MLSLLKKQEKQLFKTATADRPASGDEREESGENYSYEQHLTKTLFRF